MKSRPINVHERITYPYFSKSFLHLTLYGLRWPLIWPIYQRAEKNWWSVLYNLSNQMTRTKIMWLLFSLTLVFWIDKRPSWLISWWIWRELVPQNSLTNWLALYYPCLVLSTRICCFLFYPETLWSFHGQWAGRIKYCTELLVGG